VRGHERQQEVADVFYVLCSNMFAMQVSLGEVGRWEDGQYSYVIGPREKFGVIKMMSCHLSLCHSFF
jgi:hypothetical protein